MTDGAARKYLTQVRRALVCAPDSRRRLLARAEELIEAFAQENPEAEYGGFVEAFGPPRDFAKTMLSDLDEAQVNTARRRRTWLRRGAVAALALVLVLMTVFWYSQYKKSQLINDNTVVVMGPAEPMTEEEFDEFIKNAQSVQEGG